VLTAALLCAWLAVPMAIRFGRMLQILDISGLTSEQLKAVMDEQQKRQLLFAAAKPCLMLGLSFVLYLWGTL
jgi:hypothetical protein